MTVLIDGKKVAEKILLSVRQDILSYKGRKPGLAFIRIGENPSSKVYISMKKKKCEEVGIASFDREFAGDIEQKVILSEIDKLNSDPLVDGILVQLPLPSHLDTVKILSSIDPSKDVDGFHPLNMGKLLIADTSGFIPCTPLGVHTLLKSYQIQVEGRHVVIVGRSNIVGKPLAAILMQKAPYCNATVTVAHSYSKDVDAICRSADILIAAIGSPHFIKHHMVKQGACVIDVGINKVTDAQGQAKIVGDVDFDAVAPLCSHITPVPGGVGPMTIASLLSNTFLSFQRNNVL